MLLQQVNRNIALSRYGIVAGVILVVSGCSKPEGYETPENLIPVSGTVTLDGEPLAGVTLSFIPQSGTNSMGGYGITDEAGKFLVTHYSQAEGIETGTYSVTFSKLVMKDGNPIPPDVDAADVGAVQKLPPHLTQPPDGKYVLKVEAGPQEVQYELSSKR